MQLASLIFKQYYKVLIVLVALSIASAIASVSVIAYINNNLTVSYAEPIEVLLQFFALLLTLLLLRFVTQVSLTYIGHNFLYNFRNQFIKGVMDNDIANIEQVGSAKILASLSKDMEKIQFGFIRLPEFIQGSILCVIVGFYLSYLSLDILLVVLAIISFIAVFAMLLIKRVYKHYKIVRNSEDDIYQDYESVIHGSKELALNRLRAKYVFTENLQKNAQVIRKNIVLGDTFHLTALNWANVMLLGCIGVVFFLANVLGWSNSVVATTFALTLLFLQAPLVQTLGSAPAFLQAEVSFKQIEKLNIYYGNFQNLSREPEQSCDENFSVVNHQQSWQSLSIRDVSYAYYDKNGTKTFSIDNVNLEIKRGQLIFLIGGNGSGKSTFAKILTGLYRPSAGSILVDGNIIESDDYVIYRQRFSAIYSDLYLFGKVLGKQGYDLSEQECQSMQEWLEFLQVKNKFKFDKNNRLVNTDLSQGQRKRLAMLLALIEDRDLLLLDEWAADQDPQYRRTFYQELLPKLQAMGKTVIVISHDNQYFEKADRLLQMKEGKLIELSGLDRSIATDDAVKVL